MDTIELTTPIGNKKVVIRSYTNRGDDRRAREALFSDAKMTGQAGEATQKTEASLLGTSKMHSVYVERLVESIGGITENIADELDEMHTQDYELIESTVLDVVSESGKKAPESQKKAIQTDTSPTPTTSKNNTTTS